MLQYNRYNAARYHTVRYSTIQCDTVRYDTTSTIPHQEKSPVTAARTRKVDQKLLRSLTAVGPAVELLLSLLWLLKELLKA